MLIERNNNEVIIKIPVGLLGMSDLQHLLDFLRYKELAKKSKAKKSDLQSLIGLIKKKRKV
jgi:hypothetical protein